MICRHRHRHHKNNNFELELSFRRHTVCMLASLCQCYFIHGRATYLLKIFVQRDQNLFFLWSKQQHVFFFQLHIDAPRRCNINIIFVMIFESFILIIIVFRRRFSLFKLHTLVNLIYYRCHIHMLVRLDADAGRS